LNSPNNNARAGNRDSIGTSSQFYALEPKYDTSGAAVTNGEVVVIGKATVNAGHSSTLVTAMANTLSDVGCKYQLGAKIAAASPESCPVINNAQLIKLEGSGTDVPTPAPSAAPTPETAIPTPSPTPIPTTPAPTSAAAAAAPLQESANALYESGNVVVPVEVELTMTPAAFNAMKEVPQASAMSIRDGFATHIGKSKNEVVIPQGGINPSIGDFVLVYTFGRRLLYPEEGRELSDFSGALAVEFNVAVAPADATAMTATLQATKDSASQLSSLTDSINSELVANVGAAAAVQGVAVKEIKAVVQPPAPTPTPTPAPATPKPTAAAATTPTTTDDDDDDDDGDGEGGGGGMLMLLGFVVFVAILGGGGYYLYTQQQQGGAGGSEAPKAVEAAPAAQSAASAASAAAAAGAPAPEPSAAAPTSPVKDAPISPAAVEPSLEVAGDLQATAADDQVMSAAVQIDESSRNTQCCVVCG
jgi:hypothetical protein